MDKRIYLKHSFILFSGTLIAQTVNFVSYPVLARLYTPEDFGLLAIFMTTVILLGAISCGRFDAVIQVAKFYERFAVYRLSLIINIFVSLTILVVLSIYWLVTDGYLEYMIVILLCLAVFMTGYCNATSLFLLKHEEYKVNSSSYVIRGFLTAIPQIILFYKLPTVVGLIVGYCFGYFAQSVFLFISIRSGTSHRRNGIKKIRLIASKYKRYLIIDVPSIILSVVSLNAINYFVFLLYTEREVGFYSVGFRIASLPLALVSSSLSQTFFQKGSKRYQENRCFWSEMKFNVYISGLLALVTLFGIIFLSKPFIKYFLGEEWLTAADMIVILAPFFALRFISVTIASMPLIIGRPHILLINNFSLFFVTIMSFFLAKYSDLQINDYLLLNSISLAVVCAIFISYIVVVTKTRYSYAASDPN